MRMRMTTLVSVILVWSMFEMGAQESTNSVLLEKSRRALAFTADGKSLISAGEDGQILIWDVASEKLSVRPLISRDAKDWLAASADGHFDGADEGIRSLAAWRVGNRLVSLDSQPKGFQVKGLLQKVLSRQALGGQLILSESRRDKKIERYATRQGDVVQVHPSEVTFEVPEAWRSDKTLFLLKPQELRQMARRDLMMGTQIADAALRRRDCAAQIAPDHLRWLRVYVVDSTEGQILRRINEKGWRAAEKIPDYVRGHSAAYQSVPAKEGPWMHVDIPYVLDFGDYGGEGYVSFYLRPAGGRELVIAVGAVWTGDPQRPPDERQNVLKSVVIPEASISY